jgi:uncharacterized protein
VSARLDGPADADVLLVLAPGAGAPITHDFMETVAAGFGEKGLRVARFNFVYLENGKKSPDRQPILEETYRSAVQALSDETDGRKVFLGGKSMGGRIASHIVADGFDADGLVFLGYPLHPPGRPDRIRDRHLHDIKVPMLFVEGTRDPFCPLETLEKVRADLPGPTDLLVVDDGDHSLKVRKSSGRSTEEALAEVVGDVAGWIGQHSA